MDAGAVRGASDCGRMREVFCNILGSYFGYQNGEKSNSVLTVVCITDRLDVVGKQSNCFSFQIQ